MKRKNLQIVGVGLAIVIAGAIFSIYMYTQKTSEIKSLMDQQVLMSEQIQQKDSVVNDLVNTFNEIENNLDFVRTKRSQLTVSEEGENTKNQKEQIVADVKLMDEMLKESSKKITELETKLKKSGINLNSFKKRIAGLNKNIEEQNKQIADLKQIISDQDFKVAELNQHIDLLNTELGQAADSLEDSQAELTARTNKLNEAHVAFGTYKELKEKGLLTKEGGVLGIGATKEVQADFDEDYFMDVDIRDTQLIPLYAKKATVISEHPDSSYSFVRENGQIAYLHIDNPGEFWKISRYAIIEVK